ncbi:MAG: TetR/AcrR family transcriptional regulator [Jatrophihabitantaceae bacterium]
MANVKRVEQDGPRSYVSTIRQERAEQTRNGIVDAARALFVDTGYAATSVEDIAAAAGVGRRTVYDSFGSKRGVLFALLERLAPGDQSRFNADLAAAAGHPRTQLRLAVQFICTLYQRGADVLLMAHAAAGADPDLAALDREGERRRLAGQRATVHDWRRRGTLRADLSTTQAADVLWAMTSPAVYRLFVIERGWSRQRFADWLTDELYHQLFDTTKENPQ